MGRRYGQSNPRDFVASASAEQAETGWAGASLPQFEGTEGAGPPDALGSYPVDPPAPAGVDPGFWHAITSLSRLVSLRTASFQIPDFFPIPEAVEFQLFGTLNVSGNAGPQQIPFNNNDSNIQNGTLVLPPGNIARIATVNIFIEGTTLSPTTVQLFSVLQNGTPAPGWAQRTTFGRTATSIEAAFDAFIRTAPAASISATVVDNDGGTYTVGISLTGWYYSTAAAERYMAQGGAR